MRRRIFAALCAGCLAAPALAAEPPEWLDCPAEARIDWREALDRGVRDIQAIAPATDAETSADLTAQARLSALSYAMYDAFDRGEEPLALLPAELSAVAAIYGDPGRDTERRDARLRRDTTTFYGFVADEAATGRRLIVLRGTLEPNEWARNLQARQAPFPPGARRLFARAFVHRGFLTIFESLTLEAEGWSRPLALGLRELIADRDAVIIGHSLGGALAALMGVEAARLAPEDAARLRVVTFGSPRVGDAGFAAMAAAVGRIDRVCHLSDLVTAVPPSLGRFDYVHIGETFRISAFDWPALDNTLAPADQILCWHSIFAYQYMTDPAHAAPDGLAACLRAP